MRRPGVRIPSRPPNLKMLKAPSSTVNCSTRAGWRCSPITRAPTSAVSSPVTRLAGLSQGRSRITERSPVTGFSQTSPTFMGLRSGGPFGSGCDIRAQVSHRGRLVGNFPQSDKGRVARHLPAMSGRHDLPTSPKGTSFLRGVRAVLATRGFNAPGQYVGRGGRGGRGEGEDRGLLNAPPSARIPHQLGPPCAFQLRGDMKARATVLTLALCFV